MLVRCHAIDIFGVTRVTFLKVIQLKLFNWNIEKKHQLSLCNSFYSVYHNGVYNKWIPAVMGYKSDILFNTLENVDLYSCHASHGVWNFYFLLPNTVSVIVLFLY